MDITNKMEVMLFSVTDYLLFSGMLIFSGLIGVYFGFYEKKQNNATEYLLGGKNMKTLPVAMSLLASDLSGMSVMAGPSEIYNYGIYFAASAITAVLCGLLIITIYMPVFYKLQLPSSFDYLERRFDKRCKIFVSFSFCLSTILEIPLIIYAPALAFSQVTGYSIYVITPITCVICIFYTTVGGLKAVVWTDVLQLCIIVGALVVVLGLGIDASGGLINTWKIAEKGGRLDFDLDVDPTLRTSIWGVIIGMTFEWTHYTGISQISVQRFLAVPTLKAATRSVFFLFFGNVVIKSIVCFYGLLIYAKYADCDPMINKRIVEREQIFPLYVMDIAGNIRGLPGLFTAGVFCAALSTMSSGLNSLSGAVYEHYIAPLMPANTTEKRASDIMKLIVVVLGVLSTSMVFIVQRIGGLFQLAFSLSGITAGPVLGLYTLGMLFPSANSKGALYGAISSLLFMSFVVAGNTYYVSQGYEHPTKHLSVEGCNGTNITSLHTDKLYEHLDPPYLFKISFFYYTLMGMIVLIIVGLIVSRISHEEKEVDRNCFSPIIHWTLPKRKEETDYEIVNNQLHNDIDLKASTEL